MKRYIVSITSKGQMTLPAPIRRALAVPAQGGRILLDFDEDKKSFEGCKPGTIEELQALAQSFIKPGTPPLLDVSAFYETRSPRL